MRWFLFCFLFCFISCQEKSVEYRVKEAETLVAVGEFSKAAAAYDRISARYSHHPQVLMWHMQSAELLELSLRYEEALKRYREVVAKDPLGTFGKEARKRRAEIFERLGFMQEFLEEYSQLSQYYKDDPEASWYQLRIAEGYIMAEQYDQARLELQSMIHNPLLPPDILEHASFDLGETFYLERQYEEAQRVYTSFLQYYPDSLLRGEVSLKLSHVLETQGYLGEAYRVLLSVRDLYEDQPEIQGRLKSLALRAHIPSS